MIQLFTAVVMGAIFYGSVLLMYRIFPRKDAIAFLGALIITATVYFLYRKLAKRNPVSPQPQPQSKV